MKEFRPFCLELYYPGKASSPIDAFRVWMEECFGSGVGVPDFTIRVLECSCYIGMVVKKVCQAAGARPGVLQKYGMTELYEFCRRRDYFDSREVERMPRIIDQALGAITWS